MLGTYLSHENTYNKHSCVDSWEPKCNGQIYGSNLHVKNNIFERIQLAEVYKAMLYGTFGCSKQAGQFSLMIGS